MLNFSQKEIDVLKKKKNVWKEYIWQRYRKWESLQQSLFSKMKIGPSANWKDYIEQDMEFSANFSTLLHKRGDLAATSRNTFESKDLFGWNFYKTKRGKGIFSFASIVATEFGKYLSSTVSSPIPREKYYLIFSPVGMISLSRLEEKKPGSLYRFR